MSRPFLERLCHPLFSAQNEKLGPPPRILIIILSRISLTKSNCVAAVVVVAVLLNIVKFVNYVTQLDGGGDVGTEQSSYIKNAPTSPSTRHTRINWGIEYIHILGN